MKKYKLWKLFLHNIMLLTLFLLVIFALIFDKTLLFVTLTDTRHTLRHHLNLILSNSARFSSKNGYYVIRVLWRATYKKYKYLSPFRYMYIGDALLNTNYTEKTYCLIRCTSCPFFKLWHFEIEKNMFLTFLQKRLRRETLSNTSILRRL
jgi:hypothetical protein